MENKVKILFVCTGNICRSPTAEAVFKDLVHKQGLDDNIFVDSAGVSAYHAGEAPDPRAVSFARNQGINMSGITARKFDKNDFKDFDIILAMDHTHQHTMYGMRPKGEEYQKAKLYMFLDFAEDIENKDIPDPYYGGLEGFKKVFNLIEVGSEHLLKHICHEYLK